MTKASLKPGWTKVKFGEVVRLCKDRSSDPEADGIERYVGLEHLEPEDLRIRSWGLVAEGTTFTSWFKPGQVLFGKRRPYLKKAAVADFEGVCSSDIYIFESVNNQHLLPNILPFICQSKSFIEYAVKTSAGSLSPRTNWKNLKEFEFLLPPINKQESLESVLCFIEDSIQGNIDLVDQTNNLVDALLWHQIPHPSKNAGIKLSEVMYLDCKKEAVQEENDYRMTGVLNAGKGLVDKGVMQGNETKYSFLHKLSTDQVVMRKLTAWEGPISIVKSDFNNTYVSTEFPTFSIDENKISPDFLRYVFRSPWFWREMQSRCTGTNVRRQRLKPKDLLDIDVDLPDLDKQAEIVLSLDKPIQQNPKLIKRCEQLIETKEKIVAGVIVP
jgi:type I restriction enzyme S subunit